MPVRTFASGVAVFFFVLACVLILATISAVRRRRTFALVVRGILALCLLGIVAAQVPTIFGPTPGPKSFFRQPAPVSDDATANYSTGSYVGVVGGIVTDAGLDAGLINVDNTTIINVRARDGKVRWQQTLPQSWSEYTVREDTIYVSTTNTGNARVYALRVADGSIAWQTTLPPGKFEGSPIVSDGLIFVVTLASAGSASQLVVALRASDGTQVWSARTGAIERGTLQVGSGIIYYLVSPGVIPNYILQARRANDGKLLWSTEQVSNVLAAGPDTLYGVASPQPGAKFVALDAQNGMKRWEFGESTSFFESAVVDNNVLYLCARMNRDTDSKGNPADPGTVYTFDPMSGSVRWHTTPRPYGCRDLVVSRTTIYTKNNQSIAALRLTDGAILWQSDLQKGWNLLAPDATANVLYVTALLEIPSDTISITLFPPKKAQVFLYAIDATNGTPYWGVPVGPVLKLLPHVVL